MTAPEKTIAEQYAHNLSMRSGFQTVVVSWRAALDNYEPVPRRVAAGQMVRFKGTGMTGNETAGYWLPAWPWAENKGNEIAFEILCNSVAIMDDGETCTVHYVAGWNATPDPDFNAGLSVPFIIWHPFPVNPGQAMTRPDGREIDYSAWALGPHTAYHFKISR